MRVPLADVVAVVHLDAHGVAVLVDIGAYRNNLVRTTHPYRATHQVLANLPLTTKQKFCFGLARPGQDKPKQNFCFDVNGRFATT